MSGHRASGKGDAAKFKCACTPEDSSIPRDPSGLSSLSIFRSLFLLSSFPSLPLALAGALPCLLSSLFRCCVLSQGRRTVSKRVPVVDRLATRGTFRRHAVRGVVGPILVLVHVVHGGQDARRGDRRLGLGRQSAERGGALGGVPARAWHGAIVHEDLVELHQLVDPLFDHAEEDHDVALGDARGGQLLTERLVVAAELVEEVADAICARVEVLSIARVLRVLLLRLHAALLDLPLQILLDPLAVLRLLRRLLAVALHLRIELLPLDLDLLHLLREVVDHVVQREVLLLGRLQQWHQIRDVLQGKRNRFRGMHALSWTV
eukprot:scaffold2255_cov259-Pinguiococcus_pyrenoidosus.AAC.2